MKVGDSWMLPLIYSGIDAHLLFRVASTSSSSRFRAVRGSSSGPGIAGQREEIWRRCTSKIDIDIVKSSAQGRSGSYSFRLELKQPE